MRKKLLALALNKKISNNKILQIETDIFNDKMQAILIEEIKTSIIDNDGFDTSL
jgi:hypothetical protein